MTNCAYNVAFRIPQNGDKFNDITQGSNPGCGTNGFNAAQGW